MQYFFKISFLDYALLFTLFLFTFGCQSNDSSSENNDGFWQSIGYGRILSIKGGGYELYDYTSISCLPVKNGQLEDFGGLIELQGDTLTITEGFDRYHYKRIKNLPDLCGSSLAEHQISDPVFNFEVFAKTYEEHYAFFDLNQISWDSLYAAFKHQISQQTSDAELYLLMDEMITMLNDNHGYVEPTDEVYEMAEAMQMDSSAASDLKEYGDFEIARLVADHFLLENLTKDSWIIRWGMMEDSIGYVQVNAMMLLADLNLSDSLVQQNGYVNAYFGAMEQLGGAEQLALEVAGTRKIMDRVMNDLRTMRSLVVDVRFNGGGNDDVGLEVLRRFNKERIQVATKKARFGSEFSSIIPIFLEATEVPYTKPVYLLTSQQSASATDFTALSSMRLDQLKRIGSHTQGAISDALEKQLPNGWYFSLSNEVYEDINGECYENIGVPVHYELNYPKDRQTFFRSIANDLEGDKQKILAAIKNLLR